MKHITRKPDGPYKRKIPGRTADPVIVPGAYPMVEPDFKTGPALPKTGQGTVHKDS